MPAPLPWFRPVLRLLAWLLFAVLFYYSGEQFMLWLLKPERFAGGWRWLLAGLFPLLVPAFFVVNHRLGCGRGVCTIRQDSAPQTPGCAAEHKPGAGPAPP